jgi:hypothetical protein
VIKIAFYRNPPAVHLNIGVTIEKKCLNQDCQDERISRMKAQKRMFYVFASLVYPLHPVNPDHASTQLPASP